VLSHECSCGRVIGNAGAFTKHVRVCGRVWTIDALLAEGHVDTSKGPDSCWIWSRPVKFAKRVSNYPYFDGKPAHRTMWIVANGEIPTNVVVCHRCDNPYCVNLRHLWVGSQADNLEDMRMKGRHWRQKARQQHIVVLAKTREGAM
jgi:hypothetical protein